MKMNSIKKLSLIALGLNAARTLASPTGTRSHQAQLDQLTPAVPHALPPANKSVTPQIAGLKEPRMAAFMGASSAGPSDPTIVVNNLASTTRFYSIEASKGADPQKLTGQSFSLQSGQNVAINAGVGFTGAITDHGSNPSAGGTRLEADFSHAGHTWYDADLEYGNTPVTFGPTDTSLKAEDGRSSLVGNTLTPYITHGAVAGQPETAADKQSDLGTHVVATQKMTITSKD